MIKDLFMSLLRAVRVILGPKGCCIYELSCLDYAQMQLQDHNFGKALFNVAKRIIGCNNIFRKIFTGTRSKNTRIRH